MRSDIHHNNLKGHARTILYHWLIAHVSRYQCLLKTIGQMLLSVRYIGTHYKKELYSQ